MSLTPLACSKNPAKLRSFEHQDLGSALEPGWLRKPAVSFWLPPLLTPALSHASRPLVRHGLCSQRLAPPRTRLGLPSYTNSNLLEGAAGHQSQRSSVLPPSVLGAGRVASYLRLPPVPSQCDSDCLDSQASCWANGPPLPHGSVVASSHLKPDLRLDIPQSNLE